MQQHKIPEWRTVSKEEIKSYYRNEFPEYVSAIPSWISPTGPEEFGISLTSSYPVVQYDEKSKNRMKERDFIRRSTMVDGGTERFSDWEELIDFFADPVANDPIGGQLKPRQGLVEPGDLENDCEVPVSESVYYGLQNHNRFWVLAFDLDANSIALQDYRREGDKRDNRTILEESGVRELSPEGYDYTFDHVNTAIQQAFDLSEWLQERLGFDDTRIYYSGQGAHIYALDSDPQHQYTLQTRQFLASYVTEKLEIPIDKQVTFDSSRVLRLPYSLHTGVCRIVTPVQSRDFDVGDRTIIPNFVGGDSE